MRPAISATRAGSGGAPAGALPSAGGAVWSCSWLAAVSSPAGLPSAGSPSAGSPSAGSPSGWAAWSAAGPGSPSALAWAPLASCWPEPSCSPLAGSSPGWLVTACSSSCPGPAAGSFPAGPWAVRVQVSGDAGLAALGAGDGAGGLQFGQGVAGGGAAGPGGGGDDGGGGAGAGGQRGVDGRCRVTGRGAGTGCLAGVRRGVRRAAGGRAGGAGGVLRAWHFRYSIRFRWHFQCLFSGVFWTTIALRPG